MLYREVLPATDAEYTVTPSGVKEQLVVRERPESSSWSWRIFTGGLTPRLADDGLVELVDTRQKPDPAQEEFEQFIRESLAEAGEQVSADLADPEVQGKVVMHIPAPVVWDSSGVPGESSDVLINGTVRLEKVAEYEWVYTIDVDPEWLAADDRVYPVMVDPTLQSGTSYVRSHKSNGVIYHGQAHVGNTREGGANVYWRTFAMFNHASYQSRFISDAQLGFGFYDGASGSFTGNVYHSSGNCYSCTAEGLLTNYTMGTSNAWTSGEAIAKRLADRFKVGDYGVAFHITGNEGSAYSHKWIEPVLAVRHWHHPTGTHNSPGTDLTNYTLTPTLKANGTSFNEVDNTPHYRFVIASNESMGAWVWNSGWTPSNQVTVPAGALEGGKKYYWSFQVADAYNGYLGQTSVGWPSTAVRNFTTQKVPATPPQSSAIPAVGGSTPATLTTVTPTLQVDSVVDADNVPSNGTVRYEFQIATGNDAKTGTVFNSGLISKAADGKVRFNVPTGVLQDGGVYSWAVFPYDGMNKNARPSWVGKFKVDLRLGASGPSPFDTVGPVAVNLANGNANVSFASPTVETLGGPMGMSFTYNSQSSFDAANKGLTASYYDARDSNGNAPQNAAGYTFDGKSPLLVRTETSTDFAWGTAAPADAVPADHFLLRMQGMIRFPYASSDWQIGISADDGARVRVSGTQIVSEWTVGNHPLKWSGSWSFGTTPAAFQVDYFERTAGASLQVMVRNVSTNPALKMDPVPLPAGWLTRTPEVLPAGWSASVPIAGESSAWSRAEITASAVVLTDATGTKVTFEKKSDGGYTPPKGFHGTVSLDSAGRVVFTDEAGTVFQFDARGYVESATPVNDGQKPATPRIIRDANGKAISIVDPVSKSGSTYTRSVDFTYQPATGTPCAIPTGSVKAPVGMLCKITYPNGSVTNLAYNGDGQLILVEDPGGEATTFAYNTDGVLTKIQDPTANDYIRELTGTPPTNLALDLTYSSTRVANVTLPSSNGTATRLRKNYSYNTGSRTTSVELQGVANSTSTVTYDALWRKLTATSPMGVSSSTEWHGSAEALVESKTASI